MTCDSGYAASRLRNPESLLRISLWASASAAQASDSVVQTALTKEDSILKLEGLRILHQQVHHDFLPDLIEAHVYYFFGGKWYELISETPCTETQTRTLERAKKESVAYHATNSPDAWFYLESSDCAVRLVFPQSPQLATRRRNRDRLLKIQESAANAYKVSHNPLTQLLARDAFRDRLASGIVDVEKRETSGTETQESGVPRALAVFALDIDHFKQVNDTWGHLYGDQVLKTFGRRLEQCAESIRSRAMGRPVVHVGHPSGEEFLVLIHANVVRDQFIEWANDFRRLIADEVMPTDLEWQWLSSSGNVASLSPPPLQERATSASIGVALHNAAPPSESGLDTISELLDRADTALYRAKAAGRNQVIAYDEILSSCGRVIEHDNNTRVVALDIGSNVGVAVGQEFKVFLPTFSGKAKFFLNDGRTKRTLGLYPRVESARVVVFNAQPEISFAFIAAPTDTTPILDVGSHLEAIPAGSIGHLLNSSSKYFPSVSSKLDRSGLGELQEFVKSAASGNSDPFAIVIRFAREAEYHRKYGSVALNMSLAQLYREAQLAFHAAKVIEVIDRGSICIAGTKTAYKDAIVVKFVETMALEFPELSVVAGVFCDADSKKSEADGQLALSAANAIEFARFAAADAVRSPDTRIRHFSYAVASTALKTLRESQLFEVAYADFERLRQLGVESGSLLNLGGLIAGSLGLRQQALEHYAAAMTKDPDNLVFKSNYGTAAYRVSEFDSGLRVLNALPIDDIDKLRTTHPYGYLTYARLLARAHLNGSSMFDSARFAHVAQTALAIPEYANSHDLIVINEALLKQ